MARHQVLLNHIRDKLPDMKARLNTLMGQTQQELNSYGDAAFLQGDQHKASRHRTTHRKILLTCNCFAGLAHPQIDDTIRSRLRLLNRRHVTRHLDHRTLGWRTDLLHLQRRIRARTRIHRLDLEPIGARHSNGDPQLDWSTPGTFRSRSGIRLARQASDQVTGGAESAVR